MKAIFLLHMGMQKNPNMYIIEILLSDHVWQLREVELSLPLYSFKQNFPLENY